ncbi:MFS transporter [Amnibacterium endophyticum]|uniref:MFS transporter n=1 Tax=Amnibacterium endophyticum TaxID=2109337 RepID=A0ABW4LH95_9MICO
MSSAVQTAARRFGAASASLRVRNYRLYFVGQSVSVAGTYMASLAIAFLTLHLTGSGAALGVAAAARLLPFVLLGPLGGVIADRYDKRRLLFLTQTGSAVGALVFALLDWTGAITYPLVLGLSLVLGCLTVVDNPARQSLIADLVDRDVLANAVILNSVSLNVARVLGSAVGGALVTVIGTPVSFVLNAASFGAVIVSLARMRTDDIARPERAPRARGQIREGFRYALSTPELAIPLGMLTLTGVLAYEFPTTLPLLATGTFHGTAATYGLLAAVMAGGAVVGGVAAAARPGRPTERSLAITCIGWGAAILLVGLAPSVWTACVLLVLVGYGSITFNSTAKTALQLASKPELRGRVMSLWALVWGGGSVIGAPLVGWVAEVLTPRWGLIVGGASTVLLGLVMLPHLHRRTVAAAARQRSATDPAR